MKNLILRFCSSLILAPLIIFALYEVNFFFYSVLGLLLILSLYEIYANVKQRFLRYFLYLLILFFIYSLIKIRGLDYYNYIICIWILSLVWLSDIGGYIFGKIFGGKKLTKFSPNKTFSGLAGSFLLSQLAAYVLIYFLKPFEFNLIFLFIQLILSIVAVVGDIFFSYVKRINSIKDYSNLVPGHGGVLDRIDSIIFVFIFFYLMKILYAN